MTARPTTLAKTADAEKAWAVGKAASSISSSSSPAPDSLIDGLHAEVGSRSIAELEAQRDDILLGLLELRGKYEKPSVTTQGTARGS
jgi:hypothetical protein